MGRKPGFIAINKKTERNQKIIELVDSGVYTLAEIGAMYDLTRQRIQAIFLENTGRRATARVEHNKQLTRIRREKTLNKIAYYCNSCGAPVTLREKKHKSKLCTRCSYLSRKKKIDLYTLLTCTGCGTEYHPKSTRKYQQNIKNTPQNDFGNFHSMSCYIAYKRKLAAQKKAAAAQLLQSAQ